MSTYPVCHNFIGCRVARVPTGSDRKAAGRG
jgi:hypothetical protein